MTTRQHELEESDYLLYLGRRFWNRRDKDGKFTDGPAGRKVTTPAPVMGREDVAKSGATAKLSGTRSSGPAPAPRLAITTDAMPNRDEIMKRTKLRILEDRLLKAPDEESAEPIKDEMIKTAFGGRSDRDLTGPERALLWRRYETQYGPAPSGDQFGKGKGGIDALRGGGRASRSEADQAAAAARREDQPIPEAPKRDFAAENAAIDEEIADIERKSDVVRGYIEKNVARIRELPDESEDAKRLGLVNLRHERTLRRQADAIEELENRRVSVEQGDAMNARPPRELTPEQKEAANRRRKFMAAARYTGSAPMTDDRGRTIIKSPPNPTGPEREEAVQALKDIAKDRARFGTPSSVGSTRGRTNIEMIGGTTRRAEMIDMRTAEAAEVMARRGAIVSAAGEVLPQFASDVEASKADYDAAKKLKNEGLIAAAVIAVGEVLGRVVDAMDEALRGVIPGGFMDREQRDAVRSGEDLRPLRLMDDPLALESQTPWEKSGWRVYKGSKDDPLPAEDRLELERQAAQMWTGVFDDVDNRLILPGVHFDSGKGDQIIPGTDMAIRVRRASRERSWKDAVTQYEPATPAQRAEALSIHLWKMWSRTASTWAGMVDSNDRRDKLANRLEKMRAKLDADPEGGSPEDRRAYIDGLGELQARPRYSEEDISVVLAFKDEYEGVAAVGEAMAREAQDLQDAGDLEGASRIRDRMEQELAAAATRALEVASGIGDKQREDAFLRRRIDQLDFQNTDRRISEWTKQKDDDPGRPQGMANQFGDINMGTEFPRSQVPGAPSTRGVSRMDGETAGLQGAINRMIRYGKSLNPDRPIGFTQSEQDEIDASVARQVADGKNEDTVREQAERVVRLRRIQRIRDKIGENADMIVDSNIGRASYLARQLRRWLEDTVGERRRSDLTPERREELNDTYWSLQTIVDALDDRLLVRRDGQTYDVAIRNFGGVDEVMAALEDRRARLKVDQDRLAIQQSRPNPKPEEIERLKGEIQNWSSQVKSLEELLGNAAREEPQALRKDEPAELPAVRKGMKFDVEAFARPVYDRLVDDGVAPAEARRLAVRFAQQRIAQDDETIQRITDELVANGADPASARKLAYRSVRQRNSRTAEPREQSPNRSAGTQLQLPLEPGPEPRPAPTESTESFTPAVNAIVDAVSEDIRRRTGAYAPVARRLAAMYVNDEVRRRMQAGEISSTTVTRTIPVEERKGKKVTVRPAMIDRSVRSGEVPSWMLTQINPVVAEEVSYNRSTDPKTTRVPVEFEQVGRIPRTTANAILLAVMQRVADLQDSRSR